MALWSEGRKWVSDLCSGSLLPTIEQKKQHTPGGGVPIGIRNVLAFVAWFDLVREQ